MKTLRILIQSVKQESWKMKKPPDLGAEFLGWQKCPNGQVFPLYNVTDKKHPLYNSTVTERTLHQHRLQVPPTPLPDGQSIRIDLEN